MDKKFKKLILWFSVGIGIIAVCLFIIFFVIDHEDRPQEHRTPIVFVSDLNKTSKAISHLQTSSERDGGAYAMKINVYSNGKIYYHGNKNVKARYPIIRVNFKNKMSPTIQEADWFNKILVHLSSQYHYTHYDALGFSSGSLVIYQNATQFGASSNHMELDKFISIGGPYEGMQPGNGSMNSRFPAFTSLKKDCNKLPANLQTLNIVGQVSKRNRTDGMVSVQSATALRSLVNGKNYQQLIIRGKGAQHFRLLNNPSAERIISRFLFAQ